MLALIDLATLALLALGFVALKRIRAPDVPDVKEAFRALDLSIERFVTDLPRGYTWREAVDKLKGSGVRTDWAKIESSLADYEAYRYGGRPLMGSGKDEVVQLSMKIRRRVVGYRGKR